MPIQRTRGEGEISSGTGREQEHMGEKEKSFRMSEVEEKGPPPRYFHEKRVGCEGENRLISS